MLRNLERKFKHLLSILLRVVIGSRRIVLPPDSRFNRILVIRQHNQLGDMLCAVPLLRALRERFPEAHIALMASPVNVDVMRNNRYLNEVINYDKREFLGKKIEGWKNLVRFIRELRGKEFELAIVPSTVSTSFTSDLFAYLSGAPVRMGVESLNGKENPSGFFFNVPTAVDWSGEPHRHQTLRNLDCAAPLQLSPSTLFHEMTLDEREKKEVDRLRRAKKTKIVVYHPGAGKLPNRWEAKRFAAVATTLAHELNVATMITAGPMDDEPVAEMMRELRVPFELIKGKTIREVAVVLASADLVLSNDTGIMHVAAAVGVPVLSLFGPTDAQQWAPLGERNRYIQGTEGNVNTISVGEVMLAAKHMLTASTL